MDGSMKTFPRALRNFLTCVDMSNGELATGYAALILADEGLEITSDKLLSLTKAAGVEVEAIWAQLFAKALAGKDVKDLLLNVGGMISLALFLMARIRGTCTRCCCWRCRRWSCCRRSCACCRGKERRGEGGVRR
jgi:60s Acidic ribosomal protein